MLHGVPNDLHPLRRTAARLYSSHISANSPLRPEIVRSLVRPPDGRCEHSGQVELLF
ncbi:protein of unknown function [Nocardia cyriacigeorgica GUH-2]|uniref:Uncharacterized protein n=1 Tax=Nocardia cyriacigeorgica (strain GUH-2) TaxID=1127134 RepID=H6RCE9_NOCCG|nr:protein of unknown function [Nocardia cyriacigeorgica GUH-2]